MAGSLIRGIDSDDVDQALEIACGHSIGDSVTSRRTASSREVARLRGGLQRFLRELPGDTSVSELIEIMEERQ